MIHYLSCLAPETGQRGLREFANDRRPLGYRDRSSCCCGSTNDLQLTSTIGANARKPLRFLRSARRRDVGARAPKLTEAWIAFEEWRRHYNTVRPHSTLGCRPRARKLSSKWTDG